MMDNDLTRKMFMPILCLCAAAAIFTPPALAAPLDVQGTWETRWGKMVLSQKGNHVTGNYSTDNGEIVGIIIGNVLEGYWIEDMADQRCTEALNGRHYWGRVKFVFDGRNGFAGSWGYCTGPLTHSDWTGTRQTAAPVAHGAWSTNWGRMVLNQHGNQVKGNYATDNGEITGTVTGNVLEGYWIEDNASQKCDRPMNGRYYWGRIRFVFDSAGNFSGTWGYCDAAPTHSDWKGTKER